MTDPIEGHRYIALIDWWDEGGVPGTIVGGRFAPDGFERDRSAHFPLEMVTLVMEMVAPDKLDAAFAKTMGFAPSLGETLARYAQVP